MRVNCSGFRLGRVSNVASRLARLCLLSVVMVGVWIADWAWAQQSVNSVIVVSRARILSETEAARYLREQERAERSRLQAWIKTETQALDAEEQRLTDLRPETPSSEFQRLTEMFDQRVRQVRRTAQRLEAALQAQFRDARKELLTDLYPVLIEILRREGATLIIDADQILIADPRIEKTDDVIRLFNERVATPSFQPIDLPQPEPSDVEQPTPELAE